MSNDIIKTLENDSFKRMNYSYRMNAINKKYFYSSEKIDDERLILLWPFVETYPFKYINVNSYEDLNKFIDSNKEQFIKSLNDNSNNFTKAFLAFKHINKELYSEVKVNELNPENIYKFDTVYHPEYIKNIENVLVKLIDIIICVFNNIYPEKNYSTDTDLSVKVSILKANRLGSLIKYCNTNIRNAIAHGKVYYKPNMIEYYDKKKKKEYFPSEFILLLDNLINTISSIFLSIFRVFIYHNDEKILKNETVPLGIVYNYLSSLLEYEGLEYLYVLENVLYDEQKQIIFAIKTKFRSRIRMIIECFKLAYHLNNRFNHSFDRLGLSIDCGENIKSSVFINLKNLDKDIETGEFENLKNSMESSIIWYDESDIIRKIKTWKQLLYYTKKNLKDEFNSIYYSKIDEINFKEYYKIKIVEDRSSKNLPRIYLHVVVIKDIEELLNDIEVYIEFVISIIKRFNKIQRLKTQGFKGNSRFAKPIYIWGSFYRQDLRIRNLSRNNNEFCKFEWIKNEKKYSPILLKNTKITKGVRIEFCK